MGVTDIWPDASENNASGELTLRGYSVSALLKQFGSPLYVVDTEEVRQRARRFVEAATEAFNTSTVKVSFAAKSFIAKEVVRTLIDAGLNIDTCTMGEMRIALAAGAPGRRLVLHGNNKSDAEIELAIREGFAKIVIDEPNEPERIAAIAHRLGKRAKVMVRVTTGIHAGGHEYISTAHEDQKFGIPLLPAGASPEVFRILDDLAKVTPAATNARFDHDRVNIAQRKPTEPLQYNLRYPYDLRNAEIGTVDKSLAEAMQVVADGPALATLSAVHRLDSDLELVGIHSHIGSQIHDATAFIEAAKRMMLLRKTFYATDAYTLPEVDLGGGYSVAYTDAEESMDLGAQLGRLARAVGAVNRGLGMPTPAISFEPGRWIIAPAGVTLYTVGTVKRVPLTSGATAADGSPVHERVYVSVDGGMSDNIRPALYGADYTARLAGRAGDDETVLARVVGLHCESGDIVVRECRLPRDVHRGDILAVPVTGAYGRTMASNYNQVPIPAVVAVDEHHAHVMIRRQSVDDLLELDQG